VEAKIKQRSLCQEKCAGGVARSTNSQKHRLLIHTNSARKNVKQQQKQQEQNQERAKNGGNLDLCNIKLPLHL